MTGMPSIKTARDAVENVLLQTFGEHLKPLDETAIPAINSHKDGAFGRSYLAYQLYANGQNSHSVSTQHPRGLFYNDGDTIFGVGVFFRPEEPNTPCVHVIAPHGSQWIDTVNQFADTLEKALPEAKVFVRQLTFDQYRDLQVVPNLNRIIVNSPELREAYPKVTAASKWTAIEADPWIAQARGAAAGFGAPQEDETFQSSVIHLGTMLRKPEESMFNNLPPESGASGNSRSMARRNYNGFQNFLDYNGLEFVFEPYDISKKEDAKALVESHFQKLRENGKDVGSTSADYVNLYSTAPENATDAGLHMFVGYVGVKGQPETRKPVSFFGFEEIGGTGPKTVGGYATITSYSPDAIAGLPLNTSGDKDPMIGYQNIATYAIGQVFHALQGRGVEVVKLGGSETRDLDEGKQKYGATTEDTRWATRLKAPKPSTNQLDM